MRNLILAVGAALVALAAGLASANMALERGFGFQKETSGPWSGWVRATAPEADPYTRAHFGRNGTLPPPPLEGLLFMANSDSGGDPLVGTCRYRITGAMPPARRWTVSVYDENGSVVANPANRYGFSNRNVIYHSDGKVTILLASGPQPWNWLPISATGRFTVSLAVYDTPLATEAFLIDTTLPAIQKLECVS